MHVLRWVALMILDWALVNLAIVVILVSIAFIRAWIDNRRVTRRYKKLLKWRKGFY